LTVSDKIQPLRLQRNPVLYVRQSSGYQVAHNHETKRLQYGMEQRLRSLGWQAIEVIDEDLGRSAAGDSQRAGVERMVADVSLGKVGTVAAREVSQFARNSREWQQLIEVCRVVGTLLVDLDTVYEPRQSNYRLLLGLKGSLNEYELDLLPQRSVEARHEKAGRGELLVAAPVGFVKADDQRLEKDPDRRVQEAVSWCSANSRTWGLHGRLSSGFWRRACNYLRAARKARRDGSGHATPRFTESSLMRLMEVRTLME
jgi:DNA invertase Pin-like site-specific DNA recombinase